jgi:two-component system, chemotaxis family, chemotaxis protein CheY
MTQDKPTTVLIVDDDLDIRLLVRTILESAELDVEVVGEAGDGVQALEVYGTLDHPEVPDVIILDNRMPGRDGMDVAAEILVQEPEQHIVLFSAYVTPELEARASELGVRACVGKGDFSLLPQLVAQLSR